MRRDVTSAAVQQRAYQQLISHLSCADADPIPFAVNADALDAVVVGMRIHADNVSMQIYACRAVYFLIGGSTESITCAETADTIEAVLVAFHRHVGYEQMIKVACATLYHVLEYASTDTQVRMGEAGAVEVVVKAIQLHVNSEISCTGLTQLLMVLTLDNVENMDRAGIAGAAEVVVAAMRTHAKSENLHGEACLLLQRLIIGDPENGARGLQAGAVEAVLGTMRAFARDESLQQLACVALHLLTSHIAEGGARARDAGGIEATVAMMVAYEGLQGLAIMSLTSLLADLDRDVDDHDQFMNRAVQAGAIEALVEAMRNGKDGGLRMLKQACLVLGLLTTHCDVATTIRAVNAGFVEAVISAMRLHEANAGFQFRACGALIGVADNCVENGTTLSTRVGNTGAIEAVVLAMRGHVAEERLQLISSRVLRLLVASNAENVTRAVIAGAASALVAGMLQHPECKALQGRGCEQLRHLNDSSFEDFWSHTEIAGVIEAAVAAMCRHVGAEAVQMEAINCLLSLSRIDELDEENDWGGNINTLADQLGKAGVVEALLAAQSRHKASGDIQESACRLFFFLMNRSKENITRASSAGIVEAALVAMRTHDINVKVQQQGLHAVYRVVADPELSNVELTIQATDMGAAETVVAAMHTHLTDRWVQLLGCEVLRAISSGNAQTMTRVRRAGAIKAAEATIKAHSRKRSLVKEARKLLRAVRI